MTDPRPDIPGNPEAGLGATGGSGAPIEPEHQLPPEIDQLIRSVLATLEHPVMPDTVAGRLHHALAAESGKRASAGAALDTTASEAKVASMADRRRRRSRWLVAVPGVAAACVLGVIVGSTVLSDPDVPAKVQTPVAAAVPMSRSGMHYQSAKGLESQVTSQVRRWQLAAASASASASAATSSPATTSAEPALAATGTPSETTGRASPSASGSRSDSPPAEPSLAIEQPTRDKINECIKSLGTPAPMHVDIASYAEASTQEQLVALVAVLVGSGQFDVYIVGMECNSTDTKLIRKLRVPAS